MPELALGRPMFANSLCICHDRNRTLEQVDTFQGLLSRGSSFAENGEKLCQIPPTVMHSKDGKVVATYAKWPVGIKTTTRVSDGHIYQIYQPCSPR